MVKYTFQIEDILKIFKTGEIIYIYILPMINLFEMHFSYQVAIAE